MTHLTANGIFKRFNHRSVLRDVSLSCSGGQVVGVFGANGSGKSTLLRIIAGVLRADAGTVQLTVNKTDVAHQQIPFHCGYVAPYLELYDEFTPVELLHLHAKLHGKGLTHNDISQHLELAGLADRSNDVVQSFSSGMRRRLALVLAIATKPALLILDEPSTTLDTSGREIINTIVASHASSGGIVILATNDDREKNLCTQSITIS